MSETLGVAAERLGRGEWFLGPQGKSAWSPEEYLSSGLGAVIGWDVAAHPWDPWPLKRGWPPVELRVKGNLSPKLTPAAAKRGRSRHAR